MWGEDPDIYRMMKSLHRFSEWVSEDQKLDSQEYYFPQQEDIDYINSKCVAISEMIKSGVSKGVSKESKTFKDIKIDVSDIVKYLRVLEDVDVEMIPEVFEGDQIVITIIKSPITKDPGKYEITQKINRDRGVTLRVEFSAISKEDFIRMLNSAIDDIVSDLKKVRFVIQFTRNLIPQDLKSELKKKILEDYQKMIDNFFYRGEEPQIEKTSIGKLLADLYSSDKKVLDTIREIKDAKLIDSIIKSLESEKETETIKLIRSVLRSESILKKL